MLIFAFARAENILAARPELFLIPRPTTAISERSDSSSMLSGIDTMTVFVHQDEFVEKEQKVLAQLHRAVNPDSIELESDLSLIAVVNLYLLYVLF